MSAKLRVLVAHGSKYGATAEIAERIGKVLREQGFEVDVLPAGKVRELAHYGAVVLGGALYIGRWHRAAATLLIKRELDLAKVPTWLFSSGPTGPGDPVQLVQGQKLPKDLRAAADRIKPRDVAVFHGWLDETKMNALERQAIKMIKSPTGDFRDWQAIEAWARSIAEVLAKP
jgi:menaquinone-dependent protoporphyrinogen oxidase